MINKKANAIVLFAILGFVILISGGFLYYIKDTSISGPVETEAENKIIQQNDIIKIKYYIEKVVQKSFSDAIINLLQNTNTPSSCILNIPKPHNNLRCGIVQGGYLDQPNPYIDDLVPEPVEHDYGIYSLFEQEILYIQTWLGKKKEKNLNFDFSDFKKMGYDISVQVDPQVMVNLNPDDVSIDVRCPIEVKKDTTVANLDYFKYIYDYDLKKFLTFIINIIKGTEEYKTDTLNLYYNPVDETDYTVERITGVDDSYDIIKVTNRNMLIGDSHKGFSFSFVRENRPPDANTIYFSKEDDSVLSQENPMLYGNQITINCPNRKTTQDFIADPDEDDIYGYLEYSFEGWRSDSLASCGNEEASVTFEATNSCDVCQDLTCTITDPGNLKDIKFFQDFIVCNSETGDKNQCCVGGCWDAFNPSNTHGCGYENCPWETVETCTYTVCVGGCDGSTETRTAVIKERQYQDWCDNCGDCICSNSLNPREKTYPCPDSSSCTSCPS